MPSPLSLVFSINNLILHAVFAISITLLFSFLKIPALFLYGLHTYIHPDDVNPSSKPGGIRAAIRRPGATDSEQLKPRRKLKDRFEFDESKAQIFRLKLNEDHLQSRIYFKQFYSIFNFTLIALLSLLLHRYMRISKDAGFVKNGTIIPLLLGLVAFFRLFFLMFRVGFERSASKKLDKQLCFVWGFVGFLLGLTVVYEIIPKTIVDFSFESFDGVGRFFLATLMGLIVGLLYIPALRNAKAFWLGTDQIRCNLSIISCGFLSRILLYANYMMILFTSILWISPFSQLLVKGMPRSSFELVRVWCLLITGVLQILTLRSNAQMFLNEAVLCWYQRLHSSKIPDLDYSRAKVFLHNHYICLVVLQLIAPAAALLLLLSFDDKWLAKQVTLFIAWWIIFVWAILTSTILALYRQGIFYVS